VLSWHSSTTSSNTFHANTTGAFFLQHLPNCGVRGEMSSTKVGHGTHDNDQRNDQEKAANRQNALMFQYLDVRTTVTQCDDLNPTSKVRLSGDIGSRNPSIRETTYQHLPVLHVERSTQQAHRRSDVT
jgi:hypothetical protein